MKALILLLALCGVARADNFDPRGWKVLGSGFADRAETVSIKVAPYLGELDELTVVVMRGSAHVTDATLDGDLVKPIDQTLSAGEASVLLGHDRSRIRTIEIAVEDVTVLTRVTVFGRDTEAAPPADVVPFDSTGWVDLGTMRIGEYDDIAFRTAKHHEVMSLVAFVPTVDLDVSFLQLALAEPSGSTSVTENNTTLWRTGEAHVVDLSTLAKPAGVNRVSLRFIVNGALQGEVTMYGLPPASQAAATKRKAAPAGPWTPEGWTLLGEDDVDLVDDEIAVGKTKSTWRQIAIVAAGDDVDVTAIEVQRAGKKVKPVREELEQTFTDGTARVIDLPGKRRAIKKVRLQYTKHRLDASTRVRVYAR